MVKKKVKKTTFIFDAWGKHGEKLGFSWWFTRFIIVAWKVARSDCTVFRYCCGRFFYAIFRPLKNGIAGI